MDEVPVRAVDLDHAPARIERSLRRSRKSVQDRRDAALVERDRHGIRRIERITARRDRDPTAGGGRDGAGPDPWRFGRRLAPGMRELRSPRRPAPAAERGDTRELLDVRVVPNAEVFR